MVPALIVLAGSFKSDLGNPSVTKFAHSKPCAFSIEYDDSMTSQVQNLLPLLAQYRLTATFFINPGRPQYQAVKNVWEKEVPAAGHELADHTWNHGDTVGAKKASEEIGSVAKLIEKLAGHPVLTMFGIPGGVKWDIPKADFERILKENRMISPGREDFYQDGQGDITRFPKRALDEKIWRRLAFHGVGGEWLSTSVENMTTLFTYLDKHRGGMWIAPTGTVWKYVHERDALTKIDVRQDGVLVPMFDRSRIEPFELYTVPLTMRLSVPTSWKSVVATIDGNSTQIPVINSTIELDFSPQAKKIQVKKG